MSLNKQDLQNIRSIFQEEFETRGPKLFKTDGFKSSVREIVREEISTAISKNNKYLFKKLATKKALGLTEKRLDTKIDKLASQVKLTEERLDTKINDVISQVVSAEERLISKIDSLEISLYTYFENKTEDTRVKLYNHLEFHNRECTCHHLAKQG